MQQRQMAPKCIEGRKASTERKQLRKDMNLRKKRKRGITKSRMSESASEPSSGCGQGSKGAQQPDKVAKNKSGAGEAPCSL